MTAALSLLLGFSATAQVFVLDEDNNRQPTEVSGDLSNVIEHGSENDQTNYAPLGSGSLLLTVLGGAYLLRKKKD